MSETSPRYQAVLFDAAGTLLLLRESVGESYARMARQHGVELPSARLDEAFRRVLGQAPPNVHPTEPLARATALEREWWRQRVHETFRAADGHVRFDDPDALFSDLWRHFGSAAAWQLAPGSRAMLESLRARGLDLGVVSNFDQRLRPLLEELEIHQFFQVVVLPAEAGAAKPEAQLFEVGLKRLGRPAHRCLYVGDRAIEDIAAARTVGMHAIDVSSLATLDELAKHIQQLEEGAP